MPRLGWLMIGVLALFLSGAAVALTSLDGGGITGVYVGLGLIVGAAALGVVGALWSRSRVDWTRVEVEQRLWETGPVGQKWLKLRQMLLGR